MPKFARPNAYTSKQSNESWTGASRAANATEAAAGTDAGLFISPATLASAVGALVPSATAAIEGVVYLTEGTSSIAYPVATKFYADALAIAGAPAWSETVSGIGELATQAETNTGTNDNVAITPLKLKTNLASPPAIGGTAPAAGAFTNLSATGVGTGNALTSDTASSMGVTGAGIDLTLSSSAGQVIINGEEAAANAVRVLSAAGGLDVDVALLLSLVSSRNSANAIEMNATAGGIDITAAGAAAEDIDIVCTAGSVNITAGESAVDSIVISSTIGGIQINAAGAAAGEDIALTATGSSIRLVSTESAGDAIYLESTLGGIQLLASGAAAGEDITIASTGSSVNVTSTEDAALAIKILADGGTSETVSVRSAQGTGAASVAVTSTAGGITLTAGLATADAINLVASNAGGGIDIDSGTAGFIVDTTGAVSLDAAAASNLTVTGAFALDLISTLGKVRLQSGQSAVDSIEIKSLIGGIDILAAGAAAGEDIDIIATGSSVNIQSTEAHVDAIVLNASGGASGINIDAGSAGIAVDTTGAFSIDGAAASNVTVTGAGIDLTLASVLGSVLVSSTEDAALAIMLHANGGVSETIRLRADQGTGVASIDILSDVGGISLTSGLASADAINLAASAGGVDIDGALQVNIASSQAAATAVQITASNGAGGVTITTGSTGLAVTGATVITGDLSCSGNLSITGAAKGLRIETGAVTDMCGTGVLTAGTQTIANTNIATGDMIILQRVGPAASTALGQLSYTIINATSFTVTSLGVTTATILMADVSTYFWFVIRPL